MTDNDARINKLLDIMVRLRDPHTGCPWDVKQDFKSITPYTIEEAYEVVDAIERDDMDELRDELGDLLLQVVFHAQMAKEQDIFDFDDVVDAICNKMIRRHPHVFGTAEQRAKMPQKGFWEDIKADEKKTSGEGKASHLLNQVPTTLPALSRAFKLQSKAAHIGFDWPDVSGVYDKIFEEIGEVKQAAADDSAQEIAEELGDLLFSVVNLVRHFNHDPEQVLRSANAKFHRRFNQMENLSDKPLETLDQDQLETLWTQAKTS